ncbi:hypothetical protein KCP71_12555 [Salmonella enterica subsp. enterica]|nr:hypothetical protein KCP71_12555 [Salmonella enterica subsp. enterica]
MMVPIVCRHPAAHVVTRRLSSAPIKSLPPRRFLRYTGFTHERNWAHPSHHRRVSFAASTPRIRARSSATPVFYVAQPGFVSHRFPGDLANIFQTVG